MLGNHSWMSPGANIGSSALIGAHTVNPSMKVGDGTTWFGAPAIELPKRFVDDSSADAYNPSCGQYAQRAVTEFFNAITDAFLMTGVWFYWGFALCCILLYFEGKWWPLCVAMAPVGLWVLSLGIVKLCKLILISNAGESRMLPLVPPSNDSS